MVFFLIIFVYVNYLRYYRKSDLLFMKSKDLELISENEVFLTEH